MKRGISIIIFTLLCSVYIFAQSRQVKVTMKSGTTLIGVPVSFNTQDKIILDIAGIETTIPMSNVEKVEEYSSENINEHKKVEPDAPSRLCPLVITDNETYPDSVIIKIANIPYTFYLVRGGKYLMGYDGQEINLTLIHFFGALGAVNKLKNCKPVHQVELTSFYMSNRLVTKNTIQALYGHEIGEDRVYESISREESDEIIKDIDNYTKLPLRYPSESEWEFAAVGAKSSLIFRESYYESCLDKYKKYSTQNNLIDPVIDDSRLEDYVCRRMSSKSIPYQRYVESAYMPAIRLTIKAKDLIRAGIIQ